MAERTAPLRPQVAPDQHAAPDPARLARMLEARSVAVVGASGRPGSFGLRLATEVLRSPARPRIHLVHPRHREVLGTRCLPSLADVPDPVDLVLLGVPDRLLPEQLALAATRADAGAVVFGTASGLGQRLREAAGAMALCGAGCMGFVNPTRGVRAIGYLEREQLRPGPIALVTHSGSVFSAMLRTHRRLEYSLAVSSGQELVTTTPDYLGYALELPETRVVGLFLETMRDVPGLRGCLARAAERDVPVVALTVGGSSSGQHLVEAHSGALAGDDAAWEALFAAYGVHRVRTLDELVDTLEALAVGRRARSAPAAAGIATVHDSGAERVLVADTAERLGVRFGSLAATTLDRLGTLLGDGLAPGNPLDVWSTGEDTEALFTGCLTALAEDDSVAVVALAVDLVEEYDGDQAYPHAVEAVLERTDKPVVVLANLASAVDQLQAGRLRALGVPVLEGTASGLLALRHLLARRDPPCPPDADPAVEAGRREHWRTRLAAGPLDDAAALSLLADYGLRVSATRPADSAETAVAAAEELGYPVVLKTAGVAHKSDVFGVLTGLADPAAVRAGYADVAGRLGPGVLVQHQEAAGVEVALGLVRDPLVGALVVVAAGGTLVELVGSRAVALPPVGRARAGAMLAEVVVGPLLDGVRGGPPADRDAVVDAVLGVSQLAVELGDRIEALDVNPLIATPHGAVAVDAMVVPRQAE
jgi:acyl-CoA synthetase (NDP forming)